MFFQKMIWSGNDFCTFHTSFPVLAQIIKFMTHRQIISNLCFRLYFVHFKYTYIDQCFVCTFALSSSSLKPIGNFWVPMMSLHWHVSIGITKCFHSNKVAKLLKSQKKRKAINTLFLLFYTIYEITSYKLTIFHFGKPDVKIKTLSGVFSQ